MRPMIMNLCLCFFLFLTSCIEEETIVVNGAAPIYQSADNFSNIVFEAAQPSRHHGAIIVYKNYILINEKFKGIHVFDNSNPNLPVKIGFLRLDGNVSFTVNGDVLFADNSIHLISIDISDFSKPRVLSFLPFHYGNSLSQEIFPLDFSGWFECVDGSKGVVTGWEVKKLTNPKCYTNQ